jgi:hypothetical protein
VLLYACTEGLFDKLPYNNMDQHPGPVGGGDRVEEGSEWGTGTTTQLTSIKRKNVILDTNKQMINPPP